MLAAKRLWNERGKATRMSGSITDITAGSSRKRKFSPSMPGSSSGCNDSARSG